MARQAAMDFKIITKIKDGAVRIEVSDFNIKSINLVKSGSGYYIFNKDGSVEAKNIKKQIEDLLGMLMRLTGKCLIIRKV